MELKLQQAGIWYWVDGLLKATSLLALLLVVNVYADVLRCTDAKGNTICTDNRALCRDDDATSVVIDVRAKNSTASKDRVNYRVPARQYDQVGSSYVYVERDLREGVSQLAIEATQRLKETPKQIFSTLPEKPAQKLSQFTF